MIKKRKASVSNRNEGKKKDCYQVHTPFLFLIKLCLPVDVVRRRKEEKKKKISTVTLLVAMVMIYFEIFSELRSFISGKGTKKTFHVVVFFNLLYQLNIKALMRVLKRSKMISLRENKLEKMNSDCC